MSRRGNPRPGDALARLTPAFAAALLAGGGVRAATVRGLEVRQTLTTTFPAGFVGAGEAPTPGEADGAPRERVAREAKTLYLVRDRARLRDETGEGTLVVRLDRGEVYVLDEMFMSYDRRTFDAMRREWTLRNALQLEQVRALPPDHPDRADIVDLLEDGPEKWREIRALADGPARDALLGKYALPPREPVVEVRASEETKTIAGHECRRYEGLDDGRVTSWAYVAPALPFDPRYYEFMELSQWIGPELAARLRRVRGLPLESAILYRTGVRFELATTSVVERELDESLFDVEGLTERKTKRAGPLAP
jgi:hypothetical protein